MLDPVARSYADARPVSFWLDDPARPDALPALSGSGRAELAIVGAGFTGLWAAIEAKERDPGRDVVLLEGGRVGWAASGRNGGFVSYSITHTLENGVSRFPDEIDELERQGMDTYHGLVEAIRRYGVDAELEPTAMVLLARRPHEVAWFPHAIQTHARFGYPADILDRDAAQTILRTPVYIGGLRIGGDGHALVHPAKLAWGLRDAALGLGVRIHEASPVRALEREGGRVRGWTRDGSGLAGPGARARGGSCARGDA